MISWDSSNLRARGLSIAEEVVRPHAAEWDHNGTWPDIALRELQSVGLCGLLVPAAFGGAGEGYPALLDVCEILGNEDASTALCFGMHCVATACMVARCTDDQDPCTADACDPVSGVTHTPVAAGHDYFTSDRRSRSSPTVRGSTSQIDDATPNCAHICPVIVSS